MTKQELQNREKYHIQEINTLLNIPQCIDGLVVSIEVSNHDWVYVRLINKKYFWSSEVMTLYIRQEYDESRLNFSYNHGSGGELDDFDAALLLTRKAEIFQYAATVLKKAKTVESKLHHELTRIQEIRIELRNLADIEKAQQRQEEEMRFFNNAIKYLREEEYHRINGIDELTAERGSYNFTKCTQINRSQKSIRNVMILCEVDKRTIYKIDGSRIKKVELENIIEAGELFYEKESK